MAYRKLPMGIFLALLVNFCYRNISTKPINRLQLTIDFRFLSFLGLARFSDRWSW